MKKAKVWSMLFVLALSMFAASAAYAGDDDELPEPLNKEQSVGENGN